MSRSRAERTNPRMRKLQILAAGMSLAASIGHNAITRDGVADLCKIASSTVAKYYRTMRILKLAVFKEAIRLECMPVLQHCVSDESLDKFPEIKRKILQYLSDRI